MNASQLAKLQSKLPLSKSTIARNPIGSVLSGTEPECSTCHESVAAQKGEGLYSGRCLVRVTSFRVRLLDERNLADKYFVDALVYAQILCSDAPKHAKVEVCQTQVSNPAEERTEIVIKPI